MNSRRSEFDIALPLSDTLHFKFSNRTQWIFSEEHGELSEVVLRTIGGENFGFSVAGSLNKFLLFCAVRYKSKKRPAERFPSAILMP